jgi:hypothetical protein
VTIGDKVSVCLVSGTYVRDTVHIQDLPETPLARRPISRSEAEYVASPRPRRPGEVDKSDQ